MAIKYWDLLTDNTVSFLQNEDLGNNWSQKGHHYSKCADLARENEVAAFSDYLGEIEATQLVTLAESAKMNFSIINFDHTGLWRPLAKM